MDEQSHPTVVYAFNYQAMSYQINYVSKNVSDN